MMWFWTATALATGATIPVQGHLTDATGLGVHGNRDLTFRLYNDPTGDGNPDLVTAVTQNVSLDAGNFSAELAGVDVDALATDNGLWVSVQLGPEGPSGLAPLGWAPRAAFAAIAGTARALGDLAPEDVVTWGNGYLPGAGLALDGATFSISSVPTSLLTGTLPDARLSGAYTGALTLSNAANSFAGTGANLTGLNAANLATGTLPDGRFSGTYTGAVTLSNASNALTGTHTGSGAGLTNLNASNLASGTVPDARLSGTYSGSLNLSNTANTYAGNGANLTALNASSLGAGTVPAARLPTGIAMKDTTATQTFAGGLATHGDPLGTDGRYFGQYFVRGFSTQAGAPLQSAPGVSFPSVSDAPVGTEVIRINTYMWTHGPMLPLDREKTYEAELSMRWLGDGSPGSFYMVLQEYDQSGNVISGDGTNWYYPVNFVPSTTGWQRFRATVGPNGGKQHATNARFIGVGFIVNYTNGTGTYEINGARINVLPGCPTGMVNVGAFCIDKNRGDQSQTWQDQAASCAAQGKRMCSMAEWIGACRNKAANGMIVPDTNTEYVDEYWVMYYAPTTNYYSAYVSVGGSNCDHIFYSNWGCENTTCYSTTNPGKTGYHRRCCY